MYCRHHPLRTHTLGHVKACNDGYTPYTPWTRNLTTTRGTRKTANDKVVYGNTRGTRNPIWMKSINLHGSQDEDKLKDDKDEVNYSKNCSNKVQVASVDKHQTPTTEYALKSTTPKPRKPYTRRQLSTSPLLDPAWHLARQKYTQPKAVPSKTQLQIELSKNPYAQALISPMRRCTSTLFLLPSFFLQPFQLIAHPETLQPWLLPRNLTLRPTSTPTLSAKAHVLSRRQLLQDPQLLRIPRLLKALTPQANSSKSPFKFRKDIHEVITTLMQRRIVESLLYLSSRRRGSTNSIYLSRCESLENGDASSGMGAWTSVYKKHQVGAILWLGPAPETTHHPPLPNNNNNNTPGEFATIDLPKTQTAEKEEEDTNNIKTKLPIHNLPLLLGPENVEILRTSAPNIFHGVQLVALKAKSATTALQLKLWRLQGYLARFEDCGRGVERRRGLQEELGVDEEVDDGHDRVDDEMDTTQLGHMQGEDSLKDILRKDIGKYTTPVQSYRPRSKFNA